MTSPDRENPTLPPPTRKLAREKLARLIVGEVEGEAREDGSLSTTLLIAAVTPCRNLEQLNAFMHVLLPNVNPDQLTRVDGNVSTYIGLPLYQANIYGTGIKFPKIIFSEKLGEVKRTTETIEKTVDEITIYDTSFDGHELPVPQTQTTERSTKMDTRVLREVTADTTIVVFPDRALVDLLLTYNMQLEQKTHRNVRRYPELDLLRKYALDSDLAKIWLAGVNLKDHYLPKS